MHASRVEEDAQFCKAVRVTLVVVISRRLPKYEVLSINSGRGVCRIKIKTDKCLNDGTVSQPNSFVNEAAGGRPSVLASDCIT